VIWQLGGLQGGSSFSISEEDRFAFQHDARFHGRSNDETIEILSLFDNGAYSSKVKTNSFSRARIIQLNHTAKTATALHTFDAPDGLSARTQGNAQLLPNGNVFVNWGEAGAVTEFDRSGSVLFHSYLDSAPEGVLVQSYRGFRANWTGTPSEEPAVVVSNEDNSKDLEVFVSWNGDTETTLWQFYGHTSINSRPELLGEVPRNGFETHAILVGAADRGVWYVSAVALDGNGAILRRAKAVPISADSGHPSHFLDQGRLVEWQGEL